MTTIGLIFIFTNNRIIMKKILCGVFAVGITTVFSFSYSQLNWTPESNVASSSFGSSFPKAVMGKNDRPYVSWNSNGKMYFSKWDGTNFVTPIQVNPDTIEVAGGDWMGPEMAAFGDTLYFVFKQKPESSPNSHIWCVSSFDGGATLNSPIRVSYIDGNICRFPTISVDDLGNPIVGFMEMTSQFLDPQWVVCNSTDAGLTFSNEVLASGWSSATSEVCDCCPGQIVKRGNKVAMLYRDNNSNLRDTWVGLSTDGGESFNSGMNIDQQDWVINGCPSTGPDGVIINDTLYGVFMSAASGNGEVYIGQADVLTQSFITVQNLNSGGSNGNENFPRIDEFEGRSAIVYQRNQNGGVSLVSRFGNSISECLNPSTNEQLLATENVSHPDVCVGQNVVFVFWQDNNTGTLKYRFGQSGSLGLLNRNVTRQKDLEGVYDLLGRPAKIEPNVPLIYLYSDGSRVKRVIVAE